jgi:hypothetical protein
VTAAAASWLGAPLMRAPALEAGQEVLCERERSAPQVDVDDDGIGDMGIAATPGGSKRARPPSGGALAPAPAAAVVRRGG